MDLERVRQRLLEKQRELQGDVSRLRAEARSEGEPEVRDSADEASASQISSETLTEDTLASNTLVEVQDALARLDHGTYGKCVDCGRDIPEARLEAIPWTPYCLEDQEKHDRAARVPRGGATL
jgi:DnaK suppressor protein